MKAASFQGGLALPVPGRGEFKTISTLPLPDSVVVPLLHHPEQAYDLLVKKGTSVVQGQVLGQGVSSVVLAPISGKIADVNKGHTLPDGSVTTALRIVPDEEEGEAAAPRPAQTGDEAGELQKVLTTGAADFTGRSVPLLDKLTGLRSKGVSRLIINGLDEFFVQGRSTALLSEQSADVLAGIELLIKFSGAESAILVVYAQAEPALTALKTPPTSVQVLPVVAKHPQHAEQLLVTAVTGQEYDIDQTPEDLGVSVISVETAYWTARAVQHHQPVLDKLLTVAGGSLQEPQNCFVRIGTSIRELLTHLGQDIHSGDKVILGGPLS